MSAYYERLGDARYRSTVATRGPWSPDHQHAGPPSALLGGALAAVLTVGRVTRVTFEVLRPVPITDLTVTASLDRPGRRVAMASGALADDDGPVLLARAWAIRTQPTDVAADSDWTMPPVAGTRSASFFDVAWDEGYHASMELRTARGDFTEPGDAAVWFRCLVDVTDDVPITPLQRVLAAADSGNGASARMDPAQWLFVNTDLNVHLSDHPQDEWVGLDAQTRFAADGIGLATSNIHAAQGRIGTGSQGLLVEPR